MSSTNTNPSSNTHSGMLFPSSTWPAFTFKDECTEAYIKKCEGEGSSRDTLDIDKAYEICQEIVSGYRYNNNALQVTQVIVPPPPTTEQFMSVAKCEHRLYKEFIAQKEAMSALATVAPSIILNCHLQIESFPNILPIQDRSL